jgi:hypothetical protein
MPQASFFSRFRILSGNALILHRCAERRFRASRRRSRAGSLILLWLPAGNRRPLWLSQRRSNAFGLWTQAAFETGVPQAVKQLISFSPFFQRRKVYNLRGSQYESRPVPKRFASALPRKY